MSQKKENDADLRLPSLAMVSPLRLPPPTKKSINKTLVPPEERSDSRPTSENVNGFPETIIMTSRVASMLSESKIKPSSSPNIGVSTASTNSDLNPSPVIGQGLEVKEVPEVEEAKEKICILHKNTNKRQRKAPQITRLIKEEDEEILEQDDDDDEAKNRLICNLCCKVFDSVPRFILHEAQDHGKKISNQCRWCEKTFEWTGDLFLHMTQCQKEAIKTEPLPTTPDNAEPNVHHCQRCSMTFSNRKELCAHFQVHWKMSWTCSECGEVFNQSKLFTAHKRSHEGKFVCLVCNKEYKGTKMLKYHEKTWFHRRKVAELYGIDPRQRKNNENELNQHNAHQCQLCPLQFPDRSKLKVHAASHEENKAKLPYRCDICDRRFVLPCILKKHMKRVHEKKYKCRRCQKELPTMGALTLHNLTHGIVMGQFKCKICDKRFHRKKNLQLHAHVHSGKRPHKCDQCDWTFRRITHLRLHQKTHARVCRRAPHTGKPRLSCPQCDAVYVRTRDLKRHLSDLHSQTRFECYYCALSFWTESAWLDHERDHVSGGIIENG